MDVKRQRLSLSEVKQLDMVDYLSALGYEPAKVHNDDYWYLSPLREEITASFKINRRLNQWYDHGIGKGGNLVDFAILYYDCSVGELLQLLKPEFYFHQPPFQSSVNSLPSKSRITILESHELNSYPLLKYLNQRRIPVEIAARYCRELRYEMNSKTYYGIGFGNDSGGWEIRNPYFKSSSSPKDISSFNNHADEVCVFEGFMDFLSFKTLHKNLPENSQDFVVLNSLSFFERARPVMEGYRSIRLYLDRDAAGINCMHRALSLSIKYQDESRLYKNHKDLNDWMVNFGKVVKEQPINSADDKSIFKE